MYGEFQLTHRDTAGSVSQGMARIDPDRFKQIYPSFGLYLLETLQMLLYAIIHLPAVRQEQTDVS